jgi:hypothetical protein
VTTAGSPAYTNGSASAAVDGLFVASVYYINNTTTSGNTITFDLGSSKLVDEIAWWYTGGNYGTWKWQGSPDSSTWTDVGSSFTLTQPSDGGGVIRCRSLNGNATSYRYLRAYCVTGAAFSSDGNIVEMEFRIGNPLVASAGQTCFFIVM